MAPQTTTNLLCLLSAPVTGYTSALTLLAIPSYPKLLKKQPVATRVAIGQAIVSSVLKNATKIQTPYDVEGILELCQVLVTGPTVTTSRSGGRSCDSDAIAEEQGWLARMIHLCVSDNAETNFQVSLMSR
jgi:vacuolar protein sorting-associated protein 35